MTPLRAESRSGKVFRALRRSYHDIWMFAITVVSLLAIVATLYVLDQQQEGRRLGSQVTCSAISAVIDAGRATLHGSASIEPRDFERALEGIGLPSQRVREQRADAAAQAYAESISHAVERATGLHGIVRKDGTLDCRRLRELIRAT